MTPGDIQVWVCRSSVAALAAESALLLTASERKVLASMAHGEGRRQRALAWSLRRWVLARALGIQPAHVVLASSPSGKPVLDQPAGGLDFSLSHTAGCVVVALAGQAVGVDVEQRSRRVRWQALAARFFAAEERDGLATLPADERARQSLCLWSAREAWSKALGSGVSGFASLPPFAWAGQGWRNPAAPDGFWQWQLDEHVLSLAHPAAAGRPQVFELLDFAGGLAARWQELQPLADGGLQACGRPHCIADFVDEN